MAHLILDCPHCSVKNMTFPVLSLSPSRNNNLVWYFLSACPDCSEPVCAIFITHVPANLVSVDGNLDHYKNAIRSKTYPLPNRTEIPEHVPPDIAKAFKEGCDVKSISADSACGMFRKAIELATKEIASDSNGVKLKLAHRIDLLAKQGKITQDIADWAHQIRIDGNDALHESNETKESANELMYLTEYFLRYVYTLPKKVRIARGVDKE